MLAALSRCPRALRAALRARCGLGSPWGARRAGGELCTLLCKHMVARNAQKREKPEVTSWSWGTASRSCSQPAVDGSRSRSKSYHHKHLTHLQLQKPSSKTAWLREAVPKASSPPAGDSSFRSLQAICLSAVVQSLALSWGNRLPPVYSSLASLSPIQCVCRGKCYDPKQLGHTQYSDNYGISALLDHCLSAPDLPQVVSGMLKLVNASALKLDACLMQLLKSHMFKEALFVLSLISRVHLTLRVAI